GLGRVAHNHTLVETSEDVDAIRSAMELTDCRQLVGRSILERSGGERQRVRLARAIAQETSVLAMDEPTSHLDIAHQWEFLAKCELLRQTGKTLVISLHDVNQAICLNAEYLLVSSRSVQHFETSDSLIRSEALTSSFGVHFETITSADGRTVLVPRTAVSS
ncbi:MAG: ATP-binding cassette domain-containing protein, partial [Armatimonadota bacterium]